MIEAVLCTCGHKPRLETKKVRVTPWKTHIHFVVRCTYCGQQTIGVYRFSADAVVGWNRLIEQLK